MNISKMNLNDVDDVLQLYIDYYNKHEDGLLDRATTQYDKPYLAMLVVSGRDQERLLEESEACCDRLTKVLKKSYKRTGNPVLFLCKNLLFGRN